MNILFSQKIKETVLTKKYAPIQLKEDATLLRNVVMVMHPVLGIYKTKEYTLGLLNNFINSLNDSLTEKQFRIKTKYILNDLHCGHTEATPSKAYLKAASKEKLAYSPYVFIPIQNKIYVLATARKKGDTLLKRGAEVTRINGVLCDTMLKVCGRLITTDGFNTTGKDHYLKLGFNNYYPAIFGRPDTFSVEYKSDQGLKTVKYAPIRIKSFPVTPLMPREDSSFTVYKKASIKFKYLDTTNKTMLLRISSFSRSKYRKAYKKIFKKLKENKTENLVIDLRYNGGGSLENSYNFLSYLLDSNRTQTLRTGIKNYPYKKYTSGNIWFKLMRWGFKFIAKKKTIHDTDNFVYTIKPIKKNHYDKKIYVLINGGSFSASCLVGAYLKFNHRATFIGQETSGALEGCNAGITPYYKLPNTKIKIRMPAFRIAHDVCLTPTGRGIMPEYNIDYTIDDVLRRKDLELEKVKELIIKNNF